MPSDIFVSYVRHDDIERSVTNFVHILKSKMKSFTGRTDLVIEMDYEPINLRDSQWKIDVREKVINSHILLAIITPSYFKEENCELEWNLFIEKQKSQTEKIIYTVTLEELSDEETGFNIAGQIKRR